MSDWETRYNEAMRKHLADHMSILADEREHSIYSRVDYTLSHHLSKCLIDPEDLRGSEVSETTAFDFAGTGCESDRSTVLRVKPVKCMCGEIDGKTGEWEGSFGDLIKSITGAPENTRKITL